MNKLDKDYQALLQDILDNGVRKETRNGETISVFGRQIRHNMKDGFPLLTTKKMPFKTIVTELLWFLQGNTNIKYLVDNNCHIWNGDAYKNYLIEDSKILPNMSKERMTELGYRLTQEQFINKIKTDDEFANKWGELGPVYGKQWRRWSQYEINMPGFDAHFNETQIDQIQNLINELKTNPDSRRLMVNAWNVGELYQMVLPPCHYGFQVYTRELSIDERESYFRNNMGMKDIQFMLYSLDGEEGLHKEYDKQNVPRRAISLMWNQRSVDTGLGWGFNIASYSLLLIMLSKQVNMIPDEIICNLGDVHLYSNHIEPIKEQLGREPFPLPNVILSDRIVNDISEYTLEDIRLENYQSHPTIKLPLSN